MILMATMTWTTDQQKVIDLRNRNILVSAAAGSGKTAVLVERIITMITQEDSNINIDNLLIVTFTKAAAGEMRERIGAAIEKKVMEQPENTHLQKQLTLIHTAQITTIDSFCLYVIRNYFHMIDLDPSFRIADEAELTLLKSDVISELLEEQYEEASEEFLDFVESYASVKSDSVLEDFILQLYGFSMSYPWPEEWLASMGKNFDIADLEGLQQTPWMQKVMEYILTILNDARELNDLAISVCREADGPLAYMDALLSDQDVLDSLLGLKSYEEYSDSLSDIKYARLSTKKQEGVSEEKKELVKALRAKMKDLLSGLCKDFFFGSCDEMLADMQAVKGPVNKLIELTLSFKERFRKKKQEKNLLDFHDLEHYALEILVLKEDGKLIPSQAAMDLSEQFKEIMIDEYQDSNLVQETILNSISRERLGEPNVFMVGDVKQSIYKFRLARPELFMEKYDTYDVTDSKYQRIDLHKNFRSRDIVLDSVNEICKKIMTKRLGGIEYDADAALYPGASYINPEASETCDTSENLEVSQTYESADTSKTSGNSVFFETSETFETELIVFDSESADVEDMEDESDQEENLSDESITEVYSARELEARAIAMRIKELVDPEKGLLVNDKGALRRARFSDVVILLRTMAGWSEVFTDTLMLEGIPAYSDIQSGYFQTLEVKTMLNMLRILDNPRQDIPFVAILYSKIVGLNSEGLAKLRVENYGKEVDAKKIPLYELARLYIDTGSDELVKEKLSKFFAVYDELRLMVPYTPIHQLLLEIYHFTGYDTFVLSMPSGEKRKANLDMLVQRAIAFESSSYHGLFQFIRYIERLLKYEIDYGEALDSGANENTVRIMSIHKSKGLEFPIVILAGMGKQFNNSDTRAKIVLHADYGIGPECIDHKLRTKTPTLLKRAIQRTSILDNLGEELRILYVALTRAKEKLIMVGTVKGSEKTEQKWMQEAMLSTQTLPFSTLASARTYFDFVGPVVMSQDKIRYRVLNANDLMQMEEKKQRDNQELKDLLESYDSKEPFSQDIYDSLNNKLNFKYKFEREASLPIKTTVSELKKLSMEEEEAVVAEFVTQPRVKNNIIPKFLKTEEVVVGAARGTLYHRVLELIPFEQINSSEDVYTEINRLLEKNMIREMEHEQIDASLFVKFFSTEIGKRMCNAAKAGTLVKEQQFVLGISSSEMYDDIDSDEIILIQGIIDAYFIENGELILVDYKTDYVPKVNGEDILIKKYKKQLEYYKRALQQITGGYVKEQIIYSFSLSKEIRI